MDQDKQYIETQLIKDWGIDWNKQNRNKEQLNDLGVEWITPL